jgi:O-antigen ligase/polysaccharide polymerase Wzy-like membrane protein
LLSRGSLLKRNAIFPRAVPDSWNGDEAAPAQGTHLAQTSSAAKEQNPSRIVQNFLNKRPTFTAAALFLLILSGPPKIRIRDPEASLHGDIDWVVILHVVVWGLAGLWVLLQIGKRFQAKRPLLRLRLAQILGLGVILSLAVSISISAAPVLTAFKVYQMLVSMLFTQIFIERFGVATSLKALFWGNTLLCVAIASCAFLVPDMVWTPSEFNPDPSRLFGDRIAQTGVVSVLAMILLLTTVRKIWKALPASLLVLFLCLLVLSLLRTAYITAFVFFTLVLLRRPNIKPLRRFAYFLCGFLLLSYACGWIPSLSQYRNPETVSTLGDRIGLWRHLTTVTLNHSPWFGLGYYSASRIHGPEYNPGLGTAHSMFFEVLSGGGVVAFAFFLALCVTLSRYVVRFLYLRKDRLSFAIGTLFIACLLFGFTEENVDSGPVAICFWCSAAILPWLHRWFARQKTLARGTTLHATP